MENYTVTGVARSEDKLINVIQQLGEGHRYLISDLTRPDQLATIKQELEDTKYDLLVNNAGYGFEPLRDLMFTVFMNRERAKSMPTRFCLVRKVKGIEPVVVRPILNVNHFACLPADRDHGRVWACPGRCTQSVCSSAAFSRFILSYSGMTFSQPLIKP